MDDLSSDADPLLRLAAAEVFGKTQLDGKQLKRYSSHHSGRRANHAEPCCCRCSNDRRRPRLRRQCSTTWKTPFAGAGARRLIRSRVFPRLFPNRLARDLNPSLRQLQGGPQEQQARLAEYLPLLEGGNAQRGRAVFLSKKTACSTCHRVGREGGQIGPDLTTIGAIRAGRDILESIVFPSSTIAQEFEQYLVVTTEGRVISGLMARQTADTVVLRDSSGAETRTAVMKSMR